MRILLTNDDGINAEGLKALAAGLQKEHDIFVVAPDQERSASSHSITFRHPLLSHQVRPGWHAISGTTVDCVNLAVNGLMKKKPELVISGINPGNNLGCDIFYSGTVAGAREAGILGIPAFAISVEFKEGRTIDYKPAARFAKKFCRFVQDRKYASRIIFNINFPLLPEKKIKGARFTRQGIRIYQSKVIERNDPRGNKYYWLNGDVLGGQQIPDSDIVAVQEGYVSISPLALDFTDYELLSELKKLDPEAVVKSD
jgi:5'-nucleotidase